ncbi:hypothetical protein CAC42_2692 [Sphaceloma murrayae]|uniref:Uncharacterized protein n=1 Tax=Sphaceloma murrayae TaxID=2082308 RepID=A0A2K1R0D8_9PEZI|nr:hypothetical protein CAC42_2692 [Sphaceloma murrayae]
MAAPPPTSPSAPASAPPPIAPSTDVPNSSDPSFPALPADRSTWTESQYLSALSHLSSLQDQMNTLRDAIPSLIRPLTAFQPSHHPQPVRDTAPLASRMGSDDENEGRTKRVKREEKPGFGLVITAEERKRRKEMAFKALRAAAGDHGRGLKELRAQWEQEGTKGLMAAGKERVGTGKGKG